MVVRASPLVLVSCVRLRVGKILAWGVLNISWLTLVKPSRPREPGMWLGYAMVHRTGKYTLESSTRVSIALLWHLITERMTSRGRITMLIPLTGMLKS